MPSKKPPPQQRVGGNEGAGTGPEDNKFSKDIFTDTWTTLLTLPMTKRQRFANDLYDMSKLEEMEQGFWEDARPHGMDDNRTFKREELVLEPDAFDLRARLLLTIFPHQECRHRLIPHTHNTRVKATNVLKDYMTLRNPGTDAAGRRVYTAQPTDRPLIRETDVKELVVMREDGNNKGPVPCRLCDPDKADGNPGQVKHTQEYHVMRIINEYIRINSVMHRLPSTTPQSGDPPMVDLQQFLELLRIDGGRREAIKLDLQDFVRHVVGSDRAEDKPYEWPTRTLREVIGRALQEETRNKDETKEDALNLREKILQYEKEHPLDRNPETREYWLRPDLRRAAHAELGESWRGGMSYPDYEILRAYMDYLERSEKKTLTDATFGRLYDALQVTGYRVHQVSHWLGSFVASYTASTSRVAADYIKSHHVRETVAPTALAFLGVAHKDSSILNKTIAMSSAVIPAIALALAGDWTGVATRIVMTGLAMQRLRQSAPHWFEAAIRALLGGTVNLPVLADVFNVSPSILPWFGVDAFPNLQLSEPFVNPATGRSITTELILNAPGNVLRAFGRGTVGNAITASSGLPGAAVGITAAWPHLFNMTTSATASMKSSLAQIGTDLSKVAPAYLAIALQGQTYNVAAHKYAKKAIDNNIDLASHFVGNALLYRLGTNSQYTKLIDDEANLKANLLQIKESLAVFDSKFVSRMKTYQSAAENLDDVELILPNIRTALVAAQHANLSDLNAAGETARLALKGALSALFNIDDDRQYNPVAQMDVVVEHNYKDQYKPGRTLDDVLTYASAVYPSAERLVALVIAATTALLASRLMGSVLYEPSGGASGDVQTPEYFVKVSRDEKTGSFDYVVDRRMQRMSLEEFDRIAANELVKTPTLFDMNNRIMVKPNPLTTPERQHDGVQREEGSDGKVKKKIPPKARKYPTKGEVVSFALTTSFKSYLYSAIRGFIPPATVVLVAGGIAAAYTYDSFWTSSNEWNKAAALGYGAHQNQLGPHSNNANMVVLLNAITGQTADLMTGVNRYFGSQIFDTSATFVMRRMQLYEFIGALLSNALSSEMWRLV
jgi:hypothetical protein